MEEDTTGRPVANKPGTSCLGCRRRKLKCTRESAGCVNCSKADLPCVYPTTEVGVKRKRGPYKKDKPARQRHLEDLVKYLEPKDSTPTQIGVPQGGGDGQATSADTARPDTFPAPSASRSAARTANAEDLVKDALIALTGSCVPDETSHTQDDDFRPINTNGGTVGPTTGSQHPPVRRILELWNLFVTRVDPMTKIVHCPMFAKKLFSVLDDLGRIPPFTEAMLFSIYYAAVSTCTPEETRNRYGEDRDMLLHRYGRGVEAAMGVNYDIPALEALQALVLYLISIRRKESGANVRALFSLAIRSAQIIGLHEDPEGKCSPYEAEIRRRIWFHLYGLECRGVEEGAARGSSILQNSSARMPANLNDIDVDFNASITPESRLGVTDMTFPLLQFEIRSLVFGLRSIRVRHNASSSQASPTLREEVRKEQYRFLNDNKARLENQYSAYLDDSRPFDWMCMTFLKGMLIKAWLAIEFPFGTVPIKSMPTDERMRLLEASVEILRGAHSLATDKRLGDWLWYFRGYVQWHCLAIVVTELGFSTNTDFSNAAWRVLDPILACWSAAYQTKRDEPAWDHVNALIERARLVRGHEAALSSDAMRESSVGYTAIESDVSGQEHNNLLKSSMYANPNPSQATLPGFPSGHRPSVLGPRRPLTGVGSVLDYGRDFDFDGVGDIDFSAFDTVFGGESWDFLNAFGDSGNMQPDRAA